ncbi:unnamed protein product [Ambrosiozyma monospora]|uniref:Unnamed protein product n=1 Tax=Ambrosiozyma monospora TaxID=43982 RepID=A0ACB5UDB8_AMBMO|nr:unnamed protein product [Ambrosiozyma monospora]
MMFYNKNYNDEGNNHSHFDNENSPFNKTPSSAYKSPYATPPARFSADYSSATPVIEEAAGEQSTGEKKDEEFIPRRHAPPPPPPGALGIVGKPQRVAPPPPSSTGSSIANGGNAGHKSPTAKSSRVSSPKNLQHSPTGVLLVLTHQMVHNKYRLLS